MKCSYETQNAATKRKMQLQNAAAECEWRYVLNPRVVGLEGHLHQDNR